MGGVSLNEYATFQAANSMDQPGGGGGTAGEMAKMMAGMAIGQQMVQGMQQPQQAAPAPGPAAAAPPEKTVVERLKELKELHDAGILSDDEFNEKKAELVKLL